MASDPRKFVNRELKSAARQDKQLGKALQASDAQAIQRMRADAKQFSQLADQYAPVSAQDTTGLSDSARARIEAENARINAIGEAQASAISRGIAREGGDAIRFMREMRAAAPQRHQQYVQYLKSLRPALIEEKRAANLNEELAREEMGLARDQFDFNKRQAKAEYHAGEGGGSKEANKIAGGRRVATNKLFDNIFKWETIDVKVGEHMSGSKRGEPIMEERRVYRAPKNPFTYSFTRLKGLGYAPKQAARIAANWISTYNAEAEAPVSYASIYEQAQRMGFGASDARSIAQIASETPRKQHTQNRQRS